MKQIWIIAKRELAAYFDSLIAYILMALFFGFTGFFTWFYGSDVFFTGQASMQPFFDISYWVLFLFIPLLTMRLLAEEKKSGTIELLLTKDVTDREVVLGKFFGTLMLLAITLGITLIYPITVSNLGNLDQGAVITGYIGLGLMSAAYISIGLFASSLTTNQIVAVLMALLIGLLFHLIFGLIANQIPGFLGEVFNTISLRTHYESITRGVVDTKDLIYFLSLIFLGLYFTELSLSGRNASKS